MPPPSRPATTARDPDRVFALGLGRAFGGAILFALPLLMTMEMWSLGVSMHPGRLALLLVVSIPLLVGLSAVSGFERTLDLKRDALDAFVAFAVGAVASAAVLALLGVIAPDHSLPDVVGTVALQALPASLGALLAHSQFGGEDPASERRRAEAGHAGELFLMAVGALFLGFNIAPTEEVLLIAAQMTRWHSLAMIVVSLVLMHAFVYAVEFRGQAAVPLGTPLWSVVMRYTVPGYALVLLMSAYVLWTFGRLDGLAASEAVAPVLVLGFPGAIGAAAARLIL